MEVKFKHIEGQRNWEKRGTEQVNVKVSMKSENEHWNGQERVLMDGPPKTKILRDREKYKWELAEKVFQGCLFARKRWKLGLEDAGMHQVLLFTSTSLGHRPNFCTISLPTYSSDPIFPPFLFHLLHFLPICTFCSSILYHSFQTSTFSWSPAGRSGVSGAMDELSVPLLLDPPTPPHRVQPNRVSSSSQLQFLCHFLQVRERITFWSLATQTGKQK